MIGIASIIFYVHIRRFDGFPILPHPPSIYYIDEGLRVIPGALLYILEEFRHDHPYSHLLPLRLYRGQPD